MNKKLNVARNTFARPYFIYQDYKWCGFKLLSQDGYNSDFHLAGSAIFTFVGLFTALSLPVYKFSPPSVSPHLLLPSVSAWAPPALPTPPKRNMLSPSPLRPPQEKRTLIGLITRGELGKTNPSRQRGKLSRVGRWHANSRRSQISSHFKNKHPSLFSLSLPLRGCAALRVVSHARPWWAGGGGEVLGGAAGRPPGAAGEGDAGGQEDGVPAAGNSGR